MKTMLDALRERGRDRGYQKYERDESAKIRAIRDEMNLLHANMGGRDARPERRALLRCMNILTKELDRAAARAIQTQKET